MGIEVENGVVIVVVGRRQQRVGASLWFGFRCFCGTRRGNAMYCFCDFLRESGHDTHCSEALLSAGSWADRPELLRSRILWEWALASEGLGVGVHWLAIPVFGKVV